MTKITSFLRWIAMVGDHSFISRYLKCVFFWNPLITNVILFLARTRHHYWEQAFVSWVIASITSTSCFLVSRIFFEVKKLLAKRAGLPVRRVPHQFFLWSAFGALPGLHLGFMVAAPLSRYLNVPWGVPDFHDYSIGLLIGSLIMSVFVLADVIGRHRDEVRKVENAKLKLELSALSAQVNPHLLFNALNSVASLVHEDPNLAEEVVVLLSDFYRSLLVCSRREKQSLEEELEICKTYLKLESVRLGSRLKYSIHNEGVVAEKYMVPPLILQPLVENAIKHGISPVARTGNLKITLRKKDGAIEVLVQDDGVGFGNHKKSSGEGVGISNSLNRLKLFFGEKGRLEVIPGSPGTTARLFFPLIEESL